MVPAGCKVPVSISRTVPVHRARAMAKRCSASRRTASDVLLRNANTGAGTQGLEALQTASPSTRPRAKRIGSTVTRKVVRRLFVCIAGRERVRSRGYKSWSRDATGERLWLAAAGGWQSSTARSSHDVHVQGSAATAWYAGLVQDAFNTLDKGIEAYHWTKQGGAQSQLRKASDADRSGMVPLELLGDKNACEYFRTSDERLHLGRSRRSECSALR